MQPVENQNNSKATSTRCNGQENVNCNLGVDSNGVTSVANDREYIAKYSEEVSQEIDGKEKFANLFFHTFNPLYIYFLNKVLSIAILEKGEENANTQVITNRDVLDGSAASPQMVESEVCESRMRREVGVQCW